MRALVPVLLVSLGCNGGVTGGDPAPDAAGNPPPPVDAAPSATPDAAPPAPDAAPPAGWVLTFQEEFDGTALDLVRFNTTYHWGGAGARTLGGNAEEQVYVDDAHEVGGGILRLRAEREDTEWYGQVYPYSSGMVTTYHKFAQSYGYFVIRARIPAGRGLWPAFWLLPDREAWPPEIDVLEILGHEPFRVYMTFHWDDGGHQGSGSSWDGPDFSQDFHTFGVEWSPGRLVWYVDEVARHSMDSSFIPEEPMHLLVNLAVGGNWPGSPDAATVFPAYYDVDYVRAYQRVPGSTDPPPGP